MEIGNILIGILCIVICIIPFLIDRLNRINKEKQQFLILKRNALNYDCEISQHEVCGDYIIGIDEKKKCVFFQTTNSDLLTEQFISLYKVKKVEIIKVTRKNKENDDIVQKLSLQFLFKNNSRETLEFYDNKKNYQLRGEIQSIKRWCDLINGALPLVKP